LNNKELARTLQGAYKDVPIPYLTLLKPYLNLSVVAENKKSEENIITQETENNNIDIEIINIKALANEINEKELLEYKNNKLMRAIIKVSKLNNIKNKLDTNKVKKIYDYCFSK